MECMIFIAVVQVYTIGPVVWYQQFEYAVGHWLQKAAEHVLGCVLCCPGCFSLFRANAIMDDDVIRTYTTPPTEAKHHIQFEQGEDRWLCTLLLQQGYKIDYCAGADALTFAPETFSEFFIQRRRWSPASFANIMDLLSTSQRTVRKNDNINSIYILYQFVLMLTSIFAPAAVALFITDALSSVLRMDASFSFYVTIIPIAAYLAICLKCASHTQLMVASILSTAYSVIMVFVAIDTIINSLEEDLSSPIVLFLIGLASIFIITALCHPKEYMCLFHGVLYYLTVPSTFILLTVYFIANINNVSWGTREKKSKGPITTTDNKGSGKLLYTLHEKVSSILSSITGPDFASLVPMQRYETLHEQDHGFGTPETESSETNRESIKRDDKYWMEFKYFNNLDESAGEELTESEFWNDIIKKYLMPLGSNIKQERAMKQELDTLRNNVVFGFFLLNLMFCIVLFQLQLHRDHLTDFFIFGKYEPLSMTCVGIVLLLLVIQCIAMVIHRCATFLHLVACTSLFQRETEEFSYALTHTNKLIHPDMHHHSATDATEAVEPENDDGLSDGDEHLNDISAECESDYGINRHCRRSRHFRRNQRNAYRTKFMRNFQTIRRVFRHKRYDDPDLY